MGAQWVLLCVCAALCAAAAHLKRSDIPQAPFVMGSRYGRSPERLMTPRNDRFFMGSRYGKRSGGDAVGGSSDVSVTGVNGATGGPLLCRYTGVLALYHCTSLRTHRLPPKRAEESVGFEED